MATFLPPSGAHTNCALCNIHYHSHANYTSEATDPTAQQLIDDALHCTDVSLAQVSERISTHGDLILSRWFKKRKDKRRSMLSTAAPFLTTKDGEQRSSAPWLRAEDLIEDRMKLVSLLHVRTAESCSASLAHSIFCMQNEIAKALIAVVDTIVADAAPSGNVK